MKLSLFHRSMFQNVQTINLPIYITVSIKFIVSPHVYKLLHYSKTSYGI